MKKIFFVFLASVLSLWAKPYTDMLGRSVEINKAETFVFVGPGALRLGTYLGLREKIVGIEKLEQMPNAQSPYRTFIGVDFAKKLPVIGNGGPGKMPNLEALLNVHPDVIFTSFIPKDQIELITQKTGIPVVALSYGASYGGKGNKNLDEIKASLKLIALIANQEQRAEVLVSFIQKQEEQLSKIKLPDTSVYVGGVAYKGIQPITSTEVDYPPFALLGIKNSVFKDKPEAKGHQFIDFEALLKANPELIFTDMYSRAKIQQDYKENKALYDTLKAYKNGEVKEVLGFNNYSTNVENLLLISWQIANYMGYDVDIDAKAQEIFNAFYPNNGETLLEKLSYKLGAK